ncbi:hypothetical protein EUA76_00275 [TM7 phylum sp. oral taxon 350]|jgi:hypothetical protein|nr:hypothetical protein EUA76_00275 [TM7 phylum sp. oral taxon 350]
MKIKTLPILTSLLALFTLSGILIHEYVPHNFTGEDKGVEDKQVIASRANRGAHTHTDILDFKSMETKVRTNTKLRSRPKDIMFIKKKIKANKKDANGLNCKDGICEFEVKFN